MNMLIKWTLARSPNALVNILYENNTTAPFLKNIR